MFSHKISAVLYNPLDYIKQIKFRYFLLILAIFAPGFAHAADLFDIPAQDMSIKMLNALFGELVEHDIGIKKDPILEPIKALNSGALIVGGILAAYTILAGTVGTAHDGQMLGKKLSSVWVPIRYSIGTALVLPVIGGGYCVIQLLVVWVIVQGIGLASSVWSAYVQTAAKMTPDNSKNLTDISKVEALANFVLRAHACNEMMAKDNDELVSAYQNTTGTAGKGESAPSADGKKGNWGVWNLKNGDKMIGKYWGKEMINNPTMNPKYKRSDSDIVTGHIYNSTCGFLTMAKPSLKTYDASKSKHQGYLGTELATGFSAVDVSPILSIHNASLESMIFSLEAPAKAMINKEDFSEEDASKLANLAIGHAEEYLDSLTTAADKLQNSDSWKEMTDQASEQGWMLAGAWFTRIIIVNNYIRTAVGSYPEVIERDSNPWRFLWLTVTDKQKDMKKIIMVMNAFQSENSLAIANELEAANEEMNSKKAKEANNERESKGEKGFFGRLVNKAIGYLIGIDMTEIQNDHRHPIILLSEMGNSIITALAGLTAGVMIIGAITGGGAIAAVQMFMGLPLNGIVIIAITAQFVIPTLPYIIWIGALVGWLLLVIESVIAAPLWAIMHLHPNGDDLTGRGGDGYKLVLSLIFRPVLMVFGMIGAILISSIMGEFINKTFYSVFKNSTSGATGISTLIGWIMGLFLYVSLMFTFIKQCFSIIHKLPDQLMRWMGGSTGGLGDMAAGFQDSAEKSSAGAAALSGLAVQGGVKGGLKGMQFGANKMVGGSDSKNLHTVNGVAQKDGAAGRRQEWGRRLANALGGQGSMEQDSEGKYRSLAGQKRYEAAEKSADGTDKTGVAPNPTKTNDGGNGGSSSNPLDKMGINPKNEEPEEPKRPEMD